MGVLSKLEKAACIDDGSIKTIIRELTPLLPREIEGVDSNHAFIGIGRLHTIEPTDRCRIMLFIRGGRHHEPGRSEVRYRGDGNLLPLPELILHRPGG